MESLPNTVQCVASGQTFSVNRYEENEQKQKNLKHNVAYFMTLEDVADQRNALAFDTVNITELGLTISLRAPNFLPLFSDVFVACVSGFPVFA